MTLTSPEKAKLRTAVIVLNWNGAEDTVTCLRSLQRHEPDIDIIAVDNGSTDDSLEVLARSGTRHRLIRTNANLGFTGGNNVGLRAALDDGYDVVVILNNDTEVHEPALGPLAEQVAHDPRLVLSPVIRYSNRHGDAWFAGGKVDRGWPRHLQREEVAAVPVTAGLRESEILTGCCLVASADVWRNVGLFDERFFLLFEDSDWSMRARRAGVRLAVDTRRSLDHAVSASVRSRAVGRLMAFYFARNGLEFTRAHARGTTTAFMRRWLLGPAARAIRGRERIDDVAFRWLGAAAWALRRWGHAPSLVQRLAEIGQ